LWLRARVSDSFNAGPSGGDCNPIEEAIMEVAVARAAALDIGRKTLTACVRTPDGAGGRRQQLRTVGTFLDKLLALRQWLAAEQVTEVAMEATGSHWKPVLVWYVLEDLEGVELLLVNARHVKQVPGAHGPPRAPRTPTWPRSSGGSPGGSGRRRPRWPWPTRSWSSPTT
jgi:hypothetical protein